MDTFNEKIKMLKKYPNLVFTKTTAKKMHFGSKFASKI